MIKERCEYSYSLDTSKKSSSNNSLQFIVHGPPTVILTNVITGKINQIGR